MLRRPGPPFALAALGAVALAITGVLTYVVPAGRAQDNVALQGFVALDRPRLNPLLNAVADLANPGPYALIGLALFAVALARRRYRVAVAVPVLLVITGATTQALKHAFASPRLDAWLPWEIADASWPSGHATAAMTLALIAILVSPQRARPVVAVVGGAFALAVSYAILALHWHFPSDVLGGFLVAGTYTLLAIGALNVAEHRRPSRQPPEDAVRSADVAAALGLALFGAAAAVGLALSRPDVVADFARTHTTFVAVAAVIAALGLSLTALVAAGTRTPARH